MPILLITDPKKRSYHQIAAPTIEEAVQAVIDIIMMELTDVDCHDDDQIDKYADDWNTNRLIIQVFPNLEMQDKMPLYSEIVKSGTTITKII